MRAEYVTFKSQTRSRAVPRKRPIVSFRYNPATDYGRASKGGWFTSGMGGRLRMERVAYIGTESLAEMLWNMHFCANCAIITLPSISVLTPAWLSSWLGFFFVHDLLVYWYWTQRKATTMKKLISLLLLIIPLLVYGQDSGDQLFHVHEDIAKFSETDQYIEDFKQLNQLRKKYAYPRAYSMVQLNVNRFFIIRPIENLAALDGNAKEVQAVQAVYENMSEEDREKAGYLATRYEETHRSYLIRRLGALSYVPDTPEANQDNLPYRQVIYHYVYRGKESEYLEVSEKWRALYEEKNIPYRVDFFEGGLGMDGTLFAVVRSAIDGEHLEQMYSHIDELLGGPHKELSERTQRLIRKQEILTGFVRPDLSYSPPEN